MEKNWLQVDIFTTTEGVEQLSCALSDIGQHSIAVVDSKDLNDLLEGKYGQWDYVNSELMKLRDAETTVTVYLPDGDRGREELTLIREMLSELKTLDTTGKCGRLEYNVQGIKDENWETKWKEHFKPIAVGEKLVICPAWEHYDANEKIILRIDPGMAFGTGNDETTRLCLEALEQEATKGCSVLDIGCGSGILAIGAILLGAGSALGVDREQEAIESAFKNAELNKVSEKTGFTCGNLAENVTETYDIVCANLSADAILALAPEVPGLLKPRGLLILSGIIEAREQELINALLDLGISPRERREENGWVCLVACLK